VQPKTTPAFADLVAALGDSIADVRDVAGADSAAAETERGDGVEQPILRVRRQVTQQSFGDPGSRPLGVEPDVAQGAYPVVAQVDGNRFAVGGRSRPKSGQCARLEFDDLRLVDLVDQCSRRPRQSVGTGVEPSSQ